MGTGKEWILVVCAAVFRDGCLLFLAPLSTSEKHVKPLDVLAYGASGLGFGLLSAFGWRLFHWPLIVPMAASVAALFILGSLVRRRRCSSE
jgi:divalent metal cation (Fe/Co/Zn/Cd) transporter